MPSIKTIRVGALLDSVIVVEGANERGGILDNLGLARPPPPSSSTLAFPLMALQPTNWSISGAELPQCWTDWSPDVPAFVARFLRQTADPQHHQLRDNAHNWTHELAERQMSDGVVGVYARQGLPAGTILGFVIGTLHWACQPPVRADGTLPWRFPATKDSPTLLMPLYLSPDGILAAMQDGRGFLSRETKRRILNNVCVVAIGRWQGFPRLLFVCARDIEAGEELFVHKGPESHPKELTGRYCSIYFRAPGTLKNIEKLMFLARRAQHPDEEAEREEPSRGRLDEAVVEERDEPAAAAAAEDEEPSAGTDDEGFGALGPFDDFLPAAGPFDDFLPLDAPAAKRQRTPSVTGEEPPAKRARLALADDGAIFGRLVDAQAETEGELEEVVALLRRGGLPAVVVDKIVGPECGCITMGMVPLLPQMPLYQHLMPFHRLVADRIIASLSE